VLLEVEKEGKRREVGAKDPLRATVRMLDGEGKPTDRLPDPAKDGRFEVTLPAALFEGADGDLVLSWVDFYRN
jgi:hypothetical protein